MKAYGEVEVLLHLTSALDGAEWSASLPDSFTPGKSPPVWIGGWMAPRAGLDAVEKIKILSLPEIGPRTSSP
jgi:hypothetical protein